MKGAFTEQQARRAGGQRGGQRGFGLERRGP